MRRWLVGVDLGVASEVSACGGGFDSDSTDNSGGETTGEPQRGGIVAWAYFNSRGTAVPAKCDGDRIACAGVYGTLTQQEHP